MIPPPADASEIGWGLLGHGESVGYLRIDDCGRYREAFEVWRKVGYAAGLGSYLESVAKRAAGETPVGATESEQILQVPSASETFVALRDKNPRAPTPNMA